jgi:hypothetical protein
VRSLTRIAFVLTLAVAAPAAARAQASSAQTRTVRNPANGARISVSPLFSSSDDLILGRAASITADSRGYVYVADGQEQTIEVLDPAGKVVREIGRKGRGPGEFRGLASLGWFGDTLVALDASAWRIALFDRDGKPLDTWEWPQPPGATSKYITNYPTLLLGARGTLLLRSRPIILKKDTAGKPPSARPKPVYFTLTPSHGIATYPAPDTVFSGAGFDCEAPNGDIEIFHPFFDVPGPYRAFTSAGMVVAHPSDYRVRIVDLRTTKPVRVIERDYAKVRVDDRTWHAATTDYRDAERKKGHLKCDLASMRPAFRPAITAVVADEKDRIWVESYTSGGYILSAFSPDGRLIGDLKMPKRAMHVPFFIRNDRLYIVTENGDNEEAVQAFQLKLPGR